VTKLGAGTTTFTGNKTYTGVTTVSEGILALSSAGTNTIAGSSNIIVGSGATLDVSGVSGGFALATGQTLSGTGTIAGNMVIGTGSILSPGNSPGELVSAGNSTWAGNGTYQWEINSATGAAGNATAGWDLQTITENLFITADSITPFTIDIVGLTAGDVEGIVPGFVNSQNYSWLIASSNSTITSFDPSKFSLSTGNFTSFNSLGGGSFNVVRGDAPGVGGADSDVYLTFTAVPEPSTLALAAVGIAGLGFYAARRRRR
jgi:autotransporter-associated beta strand protein